MPENFDGFEEQKVLDLTKKSIDQIKRNFINPVSLNLTDNNNNIINDNTIDGNTIGEERGRQRVLTPNNVQNFQYYDNNGYPTEYPYDYNLGGVSTSTNNNKTAAYSMVLIIGAVVALTALLAIVTFSILKYLNI